MTYEEIKSRCDEATPGPWVIDYDDTNCDCEFDYPSEEAMHDTEICSKKTPWHIGTADYEAEICTTDCGAYGPKHDDAEFIAHARTDIPLLLKALELVADRYAGNDDKSCNWDADYWLDQAAKEI